MSLLAGTRTGVLHLHFGVRSGRTVLLRDVQQAPLMVVRPFALPCGTLMVFVVNPTGGLLGGDHNEIRVQVDAGARALVLTQSATRVQPAPDGRAATQNLHFSVAAGGRLEFYPERTIPFAASALRQTLRADLAPGAEFGLTETLTTGRAQRGERLAFALVDSRVEVWVAGRRVYLDRQRLSPGEHSRAPGVWGGCDYAASGVFVGAGARGPWPAEPGVLASGRTSGGAVWLRAAARRGPELDAALHRAREALRAGLWGAAPLLVRR